MPYYLDGSAADAVAPHFKNGNRYDDEFLSRADALSFVDKFRAKPYEYKLPVTEEQLRLRVGWPTTLEQRARWQMLRPIFAALDADPFHGKLRVGYPRGPRPTAVLFVAIEDGSLDELLRVVYSGNDDDEKVVRIVASEALLKHTHLLTAVEAAAGIPHTTRASS